MTAGVILSAGESSRMGTPKALLQIKGMTFLEYIKNNLLKAGADPALIVLGHTPGIILDTANTDNAHVLTNPGYKMGQLTSIQTAVRYLEDKNVSGILICPVDNPLVSVDLIRALISKGKSGKKGIVIPTFKGRRGHPAFFSRRLFPDILNAPLDEGARRIIRDHPEELLELPTEEEGIVININTPQDYENFSR